MIQGTQGILGGRKHLWLAAGALAIGALFTAADDYSEIVEESEASVTDGENKISTGESQVESYDKTGKLPAAASEEDSSAESSDEQSSGSGSGSEGVIYDNGKDKFANTKTKFVLAAKDDKNSYETGVSHSEYKVDDSSYLKYNGPFNISMPGEHYIFYRSIDKAGNIEADKVYKIIIDDKAPEVVILPSGDFYSKGSKQYAPPSFNYQVKATDSISGVGKKQYSLNGGGFQNYSAAIKTPQHGPKKLEAIAFDNVKNSSKKYSLSYEVDAKPPVVNIKVFPAPKQVNGKNYVSFKTQFILEAEDADSGVKKIEYSVNDGAWTPYTSPLSFTQEKEFKLKVKALDNVGNDSAKSAGGEDGGGAQAGKKSVLTFQVDKDAPITSLSATAGTVSGSGKSTDEEEAPAAGSNEEEAAGETTEGDSGAATEDAGSDDEE